MKEVFVGGVSATVVGEDEVDTKEDVMLVVLAHGRTRSKEDSLKFAHILQKSVPNLVCVTWDLPNHGSRLLNPACNDSWNGGNALHMVQMQAIIDQGSAEAIDLLEMVTLQLPGITITKRVMLGVSLGGYITWSVISQRSDLLTAAIPIITSPDTLGVMRQRWEAYKQESPEEAAKIEPVALDKDVVARMARNAAQAETMAASQLPIMAICGGDDPLVPAKFSIQWGANAMPQHRVETVPGVKHEVVREMIDLTVEYLLSIATRV